MREMEILEKDGAETLFVHRATASTLTPFLNPEIPWVWVLGHMPNRVVEWWQASLPIDKSGKPITAEFRMVGYDLLLPTSKFIELASDFEDHGLVLIQSSQRMPNTMELSRIPANQQSKVLRSNGAFLRIYLPHAVETAQVQCFEKGYLAKVTAPNNSFKPTPNGAA